MPCHCPAEMMRSLFGVTKCRRCVFQRMPTKPATDRRPIKLGIRVRLSCARAWQEHSPRIRQKQAGGCPSGDGVPAKSVLPSHF